MSSKLFDAEGKLHEDLSKLEKIVQQLCSELAGGNKNMVSPVNPEEIMFGNCKGLNYAYDDVATKDKINHEIPTQVVDNPIKPEAKKDFSRNAFPPPVPPRINATLTDTGPSRSSSFMTLFRNCNTISDKPSNGPVIPKPSKLQIVSALPLRCSKVESYTNLNLQRSSTVKNKGAPIFRTTSRAALTRTNSYRELYKQKLASGIPTPKFTLVHKVGQRNLSTVKVNSDSRTRSNSVGPRSRLTGPGASLPENQYPQLMRPRSVFHYPSELFHNSVATSALNSPRTDKGNPEKSNGTTASEICNNELSKNEAPNAVSSLKSQQINIEKQLGYFSGFKPIPMESWPTSGN